MERIHVIASQHLDVAWLWTRAPQGEDLMRQCFERAIELIETDPTEKFTFSRSTAWSFWIVQQRYPALFEQVKKHVADGRIELCGGEWVEPDHLIPGGESLIRQMALGQWYYQQTFGKMATVCWDPDVFGHPNTLPQIIRKCGMRGYYFHRCRPSDEGGRPISQFAWEAPDGTRILVLAGWWVREPDETQVKRVAEEAERLDLPAGYLVCALSSDRRITMAADWLNRVAALDTNPDLPPCRWSAAGDVLTEMESYADRLPVIRGELGFQYTGTCTSNGHNKRWIRRLETMLTSAEKLASWASLYGFPYPAEQLTQAWRDLCVNEFHDIACGSSYADVHREDIALFEETARRAAWVRDQSAEFLAHLLWANMAENETPERFVVFDPAAWPRTVPVVLPVESDDSAGVQGPDGQQVTAQKVTGDDGRAGLLFLHDSSGVGFGQYRLSEQAADDATCIASEWRLENNFVAIELDPATGEITGIRDKQAGADCLPEGGRANRLEFLEEEDALSHGVTHCWEPWNIMYTGKTLDPGKVTGIAVTENGPVRGTIRVERRVQLCDDMPETVIVQDVTLWRHSPLITFRTHGSWHAREVMLKAAFDLPFEAGGIAVEAPYGVVERAAAIEEPAGKPEKHVPEPDRYMQNWLDASDGSRGLLFVNNGRSGYDSTPTCVRLSLMRAPYMRPQLDEVLGLGPFEFSYGIMPHAGTWRDVDAPREGYAFNTLPVVAPIQDGHNQGVGCQWWRVIEESTPLPDSPFMAVAAAGAIATVVKQAENGEGFIVRIFEYLGSETQAGLTFCREVASASECDMLERPSDDDSCAIDSPAVVQVNGKQIMAPLSPFEIKTLRVTLRRNMP